ncbi:MAG: 3-hydroxyacyl-CoA dehydrogenase NAD-binding domain-containing protein, partial [Rhizobiaceae bacterium]|nr:3-hydroxyacyl-CoA dehydrogenase NAD-binding domain-containing protein [Rhizobiaceae bacterium]
MTYTHFTVETDSDGIAVITWDSPEKSMNVIDQSVMEELDKIVDHVASDENTKGAVIASGKKTFGAGADLSMLQRMLGEFKAEEAKDKEAAAQMLFDGAYALNQMLRKMETNGKPFVAAINGQALGGCLEICLACHARVMADDAKVGLPEVKVGLFPGGGGTQRVPRLMHTQEALQMLLKGGNMHASKAKANGLVTEVVPASELVSKAKELINEGLKGVQPWDVKGYKFPGGAVYSPAGFQLFPPANAIYRRETQDNYPGARAIMKCVYEGMLVPFDTALKIESRYFAEVLRSTEAAMMIRTIFMSMQELNKGARRPASVGKTEIKKIGVLGGGGFMGAGIAYVSAKAGMEVVVLDRDAESAANAIAHAEGLEKKALSKKRTTEEKMAELIGRIKATDDYSELSDVDMVIEAVFEDSEVKKTVTEAAEAHMPKDAIYASNTSTIPITDLSKFSKRPEQFIGIHFFSPVDRMMLVEVIKTEQTGDRAIAMALDYIARIKKTPIVVNDTRGFYVNRCVLRYMGEAYNMLTEGVPAAMIENLAKQAGMPLGPLQLNDETAIDLAHKIIHQAIRDLGEGIVDARTLEVVNTMVEKHERFGRKNGKGFYDYPEKPAKKHLWPGLKEMYPQQDADSIDRQEIKDRFHAAIAVEAARCVEEGVVTDVREADVGSILGFGYAP